MDYFRWKRKAALAEKKIIKARKKRFMWSLLYYGVLLFGFIIYTERGRTIPESPIAMSSSELKVAAQLLMRDSEYVSQRGQWHLILFCKPDEYLRGISTEKIKEIRLRYTRFSNSGLGSLILQTSDYGEVYFSVEGNALQVREKKNPFAELYFNLGSLSYSDKFDETEDFKKMTLQQDLVQDLSIPTKRTLPK